MRLVAAFGLGAVALSGIVLLPTGQAFSQPAPLAVVAPVVDAATTTAPKVEPGAEAPAAQIAEEPAKPASPPPPRVIADINLSTQRMTVSVDGIVQHTFAISSGRAGFQTPTGNFRPQWASKMWYSRKYDDAPMPYAVFFNGGIATHGTGAVGMLGRPASHGCIRLTTGNAQIFFKIVHRYGFAATRIKVRGSIGGDAIARRKDRDQPKIAAFPVSKPDLRVAAARQLKSKAVKVAAPQKVAAHRPAVSGVPASGLGYRTGKPRIVQPVQPVAFRPAYRTSNIGW